MFFTVISPKAENYTEYSDKIMHCSHKRNFRYIVLEHGQNNDHPHLNIIWEPSIKKTSDCNKYFYRLLNVDPNGILCRTQVVSNLTYLIGTYLEKEPNREVLLNNYFPDEYQKFFIKVDLPKKDYKYLAEPTQRQFAPFYIDFCQQHDIDPVNFQLVWNTMQAHNIRLDHLYYRRRALMDQIYGMLFIKKPDNLSLDII